VGSNGQRFGANRQDKDPDGFPILSQSNDWPEMHTSSKPRFSCRRCAATVEASAGRCYNQTTSRTRHHRRGESRHNNDVALVGPLVAPVTSDTHSPGIDMAGNGAIGVSVTAVIAGPVTITISWIAVAGSATIAVSRIAITIAISRVA